MKTMKSHFVKKAVVLGICASPMFLHAQSDYRLEEVVVTATKREQSLSDVGLTVSALSGEQLQMKGIANVVDLALSTPGLTYAPTPSGTPVYSMRGIGFFESSLSAYPTVSLYQNQVPMPFPVMSSLVAFDLERVEIMKGPQGTLFGNNATGGAINFIPAQPTEEFSAGIDLGYGRFDTKTIGGFVSGSVTDSVRARAAVKWEKGDEWQRSFTRDDENGKKDNIAARVLVDWDVSESLSLKFNFNGWRNRDETQAPSAIAIRPQNPIGSVGFGGAVTGNEAIFQHPLGPKDNRRADWVEGLPYQDSEFLQGSVRADYEFNNGMTLTSITSYSDYDHENANDGSGVSLMNMDIVQDKGDIESFSQEIRLANDPAERLRWMIGANYEKSEVYQGADLFYQDTTSYLVNGIHYNHYWADHEMENLAGFFNLEFDLNDQITLKAGARQTNAKRDSVAYTGDLGRSEALGGYRLTDFFNMVYGAVYGGAVPVIQPGESVVLNTDTLTTMEPRSKLDEDSTSWSVGVDYKITPDALLYANVMKGYKAGSTPHLSGSIVRAFEPARHESVVTVELGFKLTTQNGRHAINGAVFHNSYENKQTRSKFIDPIFSELDLLLNVPESNIQGAELEITSRLLEGLTVSASATYLDSEIRDYDGVVGSRTLPNGLLEAVTTSYRGVSLPHAPRWSYSLRADYEHGMGNGLVGFAGVGVDGQSDSIGVLTAISEEKDLFKIDSYALVSANLGVRTEDGRWQVMLWGKNITDKTYWTHAMTGYDTAIRYYGRPAEYGISMAYRF